MIKPAKVASQVSASVSTSSVNINDTISSTYVVHVRHFHDRAANIRRQLDGAGLPFEFVELYDADQIDETTRSRYWAEGSPLSVAQFSCVLKHIEAMRRIVERNEAFALVLEDDAILAERFCAKLSEFLTEARKFKGPYTIQIGCACNMYVRKNRLVPGRQLYLADEVRATDSYVITQEAARRRLDWLSRNKVSLTAGHLFNRIDREMGINIYWSEPTIVVQGTANGLFPTSIDVAQMGKPLWLIKCGFAWQYFRKRFVYPLFQGSKSSAESQPVPEDETDFVLNHE